MCGLVWAGRPTTRLISCAWFVPPVPASWTSCSTRPPSRCQARASPSTDARLRARLVLAPTDLLRDAVYRRLWISILISSFGGQVTILALPLTAAVLMHASPTQMGALTAMEIVPFVLFSLPTGVWLDRLRKLPVYVMGELSIACAVTSVPLAWWLGWLSMTC